MGSDSIFYDSGYMYMSLILVFFIVIMTSMLITASLANEMQIIDNLVYDKMNLYKIYSEVLLLEKNQKFLGKIEDWFIEKQKSSLIMSKYSSNFNLDSKLFKKQIPVKVSYDSSNSISELVLYFGQRNRKNSKSIIAKLNIVNPILSKERPILSKSDLDTEREYTELNRFLNLSEEDSTLLYEETGKYSGVYIVDKFILEEDFSLKGILIIKSPIIYIKNGVDFSVDGLIILADEDGKNDLKEADINYSIDNIIRYCYDFPGIIKLSLKNLKFIGG